MADGFQPPSGRRAAFRDSGSVSVPLDRWMRTLTMRRVAESEVNLLDGESRLLAERYAEGVNACIRSEPLPLEFRLLKFAA